MRIVHYDMGKTLVAGVFVPVIGSGVITGRIEINGGRERAYMVQPSDGGEARIVRASSLVTVH